MDILGFLGAIAILLAILGIAHVLALGTGAIIALFIVGAFLLFVGFGPRARGGGRLFR